jgi:hypothetical protein
MSDTWPWIVKCTDIGVGAAIIILLVSFAWSWADAIDWKLKQ